MVCDAILSALRRVSASRRHGGAVVVLALKRKVNNRQKVNQFDFIGETERIRGIHIFTCTKHRQNQSRGGDTHIMAKPLPLFTLRGKKYPVLINTWAGIFPLVYNGYRVFPGGKAGGALR